MSHHDLSAEFLNMLLDYSRCPWLEYAASEVRAGVREDTRPGHSNPRIDEYLSTVGMGDDDTPWCSAFVNWSMMQAGIPGTGKANARSWLHWGTAIVDCRLGAVAVLSRGNNNWQGHVTFYVGDNGANLLCLGGNQGNAVCVRPYARTRLLGMRWPFGY
ncbi:MAG TPA: TIGR02594 family protein [Bryobacteraceae bacterium]|nr:TIGR02594 family protein [Bryobacteraceae bacterium]